MKDVQHQRLHLTQGGRFLGWDPDTREETAFDFLHECRGADEVPAGEVFARHLASDGVVTADVFSGLVRFGKQIKAKDRPMLEERAKEISGDSTVDFDRVMKARWSLATPNRSNIIVPNDAWDLEKFNGSNPVGAWNHRTSFSSPEMIIARWLMTGHQNSRPTSDLIGFSEMVPHDTNPVATTVLGLYQFGALNAFSPGFLPGSITFNEEDSTLTFGSKEKKNELVELSFVPVPRHADAVRLALQGGAVELGPLRNLIAAQIEMAYSSPQMLMETAQLEALATKLGLVDANAMVQLGAEEIESLELPGSAKEPERFSDQEIAEFLRGEDEECPEGFDEESWGRFSAATNGGDPDSVLLVAARGAGLLEEANALERAMALGVEDQSQEENNEDGAEGENQESAQSFTAADFKAALDSDPVISKFRTRLENQTGKILIPD